MGNCDLGHSLFMDKSRIKIFCGSSEKVRFAWPRKSYFHGYCPEKEFLFLSDNTKPILTISPQSKELAFDRYDENFRFQPSRKN